MRDLLLGLAMGLAATSATACEWSDVDHKITRDESGVWNPNVYRSVAVSLTAAQIAGALWEGTDSRFGRTMWQGMDSQLLTQGAVEVMKRAFSRVRPAETDSPCEWFGSRGNASFPSGEAASATALVMPYVLEYGPDDPAIYTLLAFPLYVGIGRLKAQAHWQTDVAAGWIVGGLLGWYAHERTTALLVEILPDGVTVGLKKRF